MPDYIPYTENELDELLKSCGIPSVKTLFSQIPDEVKLKEPVGLPEGMSEMELSDHMSKLSEKNSPAGRMNSFLGCGVYDHYVPSAISSLLSRQEFFTAYTPYQPEISQGTLASIFEYQTMMCGLTKLDVSNASLYDKATAAAEAMLISKNHTNRNKILVSRAVHPDILETLRTYARFSSVSITEAPFDINTLKTNMSDLIDGDTAAIIVQNPNFFGILEDIEVFSDEARKSGALSIAVCDPLSLAILKPPGDAGYDIAVGDTQPLGLEMSYGGPFAGYMCVNKSLMRRIPGRVVGMTEDRNKKRAFVLTLQAREQHIRRERATSNICSNQALCALASTIYLSLMGPKGLFEAASLCAKKALYTKESLVSTGKFLPFTDSKFFREFVVKAKTPINKINGALRGHGIVGGYDLSRLYPELENCWLIAVTEKKSRGDIDDFVKKASEVV